MLLCYFITNCVSFLLLHIPTQTCDEEKWREAFALVLLAMCSRVESTIYRSRQNEKRRQRTKQHKNVAQKSEWERMNLRGRTSEKKNISHKNPTRLVFLLHYRMQFAVPFFSSSSRCWLLSCGRKLHEWCNFLVMSDCYRNRQFMQR